MKTNYVCGYISAGGSRDLWKSSDLDPDVLEETFIFASESLEWFVKQIDADSYVCGDFKGDRTLYLCVDSKLRVTHLLLLMIQNWLRLHRDWRVAIPIGKSEEAIICYFRKVFVGRKEIVVADDTFSDSEELYPL